ncbi:nuclear transport factor 2 family protein [Ktedonobacter racemifer]|uniref:SnoaL-like domain-containing protein n=1 Tax=Ktedonobacter racemifer DSM 44963 TaxID=485913 RepID=D6TSC1_KTERA|nr:nuclear transport factor 2 family protein [Ktedonobacter racemifer]EFH83322.1 conserved hypothetical protein [Ktedonobacter racemifer DSM 44963]
MPLSEDILQRLETLESENMIRRLMADYTEVRDRNIGEGDYISNLFTPDGIWEGTGQFEKTLGRFEGREAIRQRFSQKLPFAIHYLTNECITVNGETAVGKWKLWHPSTIQGRAMWVAGHYHNNFIRIDEVWKFRHLRISAIFVAPYEEGWAKIPD